MYDWAILILRVCLGVIFLAHGSQVAFGMLGGPGIHAFSEMISGLGFKPALFWAYAAAYVEVLGGAFLIFGVLTRTAALFLLIFMVVAVIKVHLGKGFFIQSGGFEYNFVIACICIALILTGPGKFSIMKQF